MMKYIYILLTNTKTLLSRGIHFVTNHPYTHASISLDNELKEMYSFARKQPRNPFVGTFIKEDINSGVYALCKDTTCVLLRISVEEYMFYHIQTEIEGFIQNQNDEPYAYNFIGLFGVYLNKPVEREYAFFCSEFIATVLLRSGYNRLSKPPSLMTPNDFLDLPASEILFEGKLCDLKPCSIKNIHSSA